MYIYSNILGIFVFDDEIKVIDKTMFDNFKDSQNKEKFFEEIKNKHENLKEPDNITLREILLHFKNKQFFEDFYNKNLQLTKFDIRNSVKDDVLIIQAINSLEEIDRAINLLIKRLREWYELYNPETSRAIQNHEKFVEKIIDNEKNALLEQIGIKSEDSVGVDFGKGDLEPVRMLINQCHDLYQLRKVQVTYISTLMDRLCPNLKEICGNIIGAQLIEKARSLKRLSEMPSSTIQILGAESALFRHMKTGAKPPRHGIIVNHLLIAKAPDRLHGKIARTLADKISIASKVDYFKGEFIGDKLKKDLQDKFGSF